MAALVLGLGWPSTGPHAQADTDGTAPCRGHAAPLLDTSLPADHGHDGATCALACCTACGPAMTLPALPSRLPAARHRPHPPGRRRERGRRPRALLRPPRY